MSLCRCHLGAKHAWPYHICCSLWLFYHHKQHRLYHCSQENVSLTHCVQWDCPWIHKAVWCFLLELTARQLVFTNTGACSWIYRQLGPCRTWAPSLCLILLSWHTKLLVSLVQSFPWIAMKHLCCQLLSETMKVNGVLKCPLRIMLTFSTLKIHVTCSDNSQCLCMVHRRMPVLPRSTNRTMTVLVWYGNKIGGISVAYL